MWHGSLSAKVNKNASLGYSHACKISITAPTITVPSISIQGESLLTTAVEGSQSVCAVLLAVIHFPELTLINICLLSNTVTACWSSPTNVMHSIYKST